MIDGKDFLYQTIVNYIKAYVNIRKITTDHVDDYLFST